MKRHYFIVILFLLSFCSLKAQITFVKDGKAHSQIIVNGERNDYRAALLLQNFVKRISNAELTVKSVKGCYAAKKGDIVLGNNQQLPSDLRLKKASLSEDGYILSTKDGVLRIINGGDKGTIYGVVSMFEQYFGVDYWSENNVTYQKRSEMSLPTVCLMDNPAFRYRQSQNYAMATDSIYGLWYRLEEPKEVFAATYWVHTFDKLLPSAIYGKTHPEYYAYYNGTRHPGKASQWCLTNPNVFEIVAARIDSIFKANPDKKIISVSQNDGNYTNCTCPSCKAIDDKEGALSGSVITFLNKLAARFPDKEFSTLAYLYTMNPPKHVKPLSNVNIMLCDIDCDREVSLTENKSGREFVKALEGWSAITNNIFVWDYGINFDNYLSPFPNFHVLQDNICLFKKNHATMHFSQIASSRGGNFAELRTYLVSKLMWNPNVDVDSLTRHFLKGYYGKADKYIYQYIKLMEGAMMGSGDRLWIYDSPVSHKNGILCPALRKRYNKLFDDAERIVADDKDYLAHVRKERLTLQYSELEILRTQQKKDLDDVSHKLNLFEERVKEFKVPTLNERSNSPVEYCNLYRIRYMPSLEKDLSRGAKITYIVPPADRYKQLAETAMTDGLFGGATYVDSWIGWEGVDASFVVDLGEEKNFQEIDTDFLHQLGAWILLPKKVSYSFSKDGISYKLIKEHVLSEDRSVQVKFVNVKSQLPEKACGRYIKVDVEGTKECPSWHYGVGHKCWFFIDEVTVK